VVAWALIGGGIAILAIERVKPPATIHETEEMGFKTALAIGFMQCLAMIPGVSRSGATIMGALMMNDETLYERLAFIHNSCGATPGPMDSFLVLRGIKTLHLRMKAHCENGKAVAHFLRNHPKVDKVYWPGFEDHPNHEIAKTQMRDFGGMISFTTKNASIEDTFKLASSFKVFSLAESLGGVESSINHPATMTHASIPKADRETAGVVDSLLRLSVGVEDIEDLLEDLAQALN
jgi:cystathionine gamma-lyase/cystathionine beta-lyase